MLILNKIQTIYKHHRAKDLKSSQAMFKSLYEEYDKYCYTYQDYSETFFNYLIKEPIFETAFTIIFSAIVSFLISQIDALADIPFLFIISILMIFIFVIFMLSTEYSSLKDVYCSKYLSYSDFIRYVSKKYFKSEDMDNVPIEEYYQRIFMIKEGIVIRKSEEPDKMEIQKLMTLCFGDFDLSEAYENLENRYELYFQYGTLVAMSGIKLYSYHNEITVQSIDWTCIHPDYNDKIHLECLFNEILKDTNGKVYINYSKIPDQETCDRVCFFTNPQGCVCA